MSRKLASLLLVLVASVVLAEDTGKRKIAKLYLSGDRIVEGEITAEDDLTITIKTDVAEAPFQKKEVLYALRGEATGDELKAKKKAQNNYTSLLLGYKLKKPDDWSFKLDPPEPLSDVLIHLAKDDARISVFGMPDDAPDREIDDAAIKSLADTGEAKLKEKFSEVKRTAAEKTKWKDAPAAFIEFTMKSKESKKDYKNGEIVFKNKKKILFFAVWAPVTKYDKCKAAFDEVMASIELTDSNPQDGDRLWNQELLYVLHKPSDWTYAKNSEMAAPKNEAWLRVEPRKLEANATLDAWAKDEEPKVGSGIKDLKKTQGSPANFAGRLGYQLTFEYQDGGRTRRRQVWLLKEQDRGYVLSADSPTDKEQYAPLIAEAVGKFRILNNLLGEGALEKGLEAIDLFDRGDVKLNTGDYAAATSLYEQAIAVYPRYAAAWNNLGVACDRLKDFDKSKRASQRAYDLFPEDPLARANLGLSLLRDAMKDLDSKKGEEAGRAVDRARTLIPADTNDGLKNDLAVVLENVSLYYEEKENWTVAEGYAQKALAVKPGDQNLTKHLANVYTNAAVVSWNKKNKSSASSWAQKALKIDPQNAKAKEVLDACKKSK